MNDVHGEDFSELVDELNEFQDNFSRSEEDGWFYPDDDENE